MAIETKPVPIPKGTSISVAEAAEFAEVSGDTIRRLAIAQGLGRQPGGRSKRWRISYPALSAYLAGDRVALAALREGRFDHPSVTDHMAGRFQAGARG